MHGQVGHSRSRESNVQWAIGETGPYIVAGLSISFQRTCQRPCDKPSALIQPSTAALLLALPSWMGAESKGSQGGSKTLQLLALRRVQAAADGVATTRCHCAVARSTCTSPSSNSVPASSTASSMSSSSA